MTWRPWQPPSLPRPATPLPAAPDARAPRRTREQWFAELSEWLPESSVLIHAEELASLYVRGESPAMAGAYARAWLAVPKLELAAP